MNLGLDVGSVSLKLAFFEGGQLRSVAYHRHRGRPLNLLLELLKDGDGVDNLALTGGGSALLGELIGGLVVNEIVAAVEGIKSAAPALKTVIEIGGEDSKLFILDGDLKDFTTNTICAAGTGIFLDQQAHRLNLTIEEFARRALDSTSPARIAGRCSVFAKSDMIHLQQIGTPMVDIIAGVCRALARNFKSVIAKGKRFERPIGFIGGVAANRGLVRAFETVLGLEPGELVVPEHFNCLGAIGSWRYAEKSGQFRRFEGFARLREYMIKPRPTRRLPPLDGHGISLPKRHHESPSKRVKGYLGIDVGSVSTNLVVVDDSNRVLSRSYLWTQGDPIRAVKTGLEQLNLELGDRVEIAAVGTTGSGRYLAGDFVGADVIKNEITAQATAAVHFDPTVDTIFEIGGQDSKYVSLENGVVVDFEMNKICAAGTGSFLEEQAKILDTVIEDFGATALESKAPVYLGERCTVFMESEMLQQQQLFTGKADVLAGLAYSIAENYLNRVVQGKKIGRRILFQGGVAANKAVISAFEHVLGRKVVVPDNFDVTGAIGVAMIARDHINGGATAFKGFARTQQPCQTHTFECSKCSNLCDVNVVEVTGEKPIYYGGRCERYEQRETEQKTTRPDYFKQRNEIFYKVEANTGTPIGVPRALVFHEMFPFFSRVLTSLGFNVVLSEPTNKSITHLGVEYSGTETCFPVKVGNGHVLNLIERGIKLLFMPSVITVHKQKGFSGSYVCPYVQTMPYIVRAGLCDKLAGIDIVAPVFSFDRPMRHAVRSFFEALRRFGVKERAVRNAVSEAWTYHEKVNQEVMDLGRDALGAIGETAFVVVSRPYNGYDMGVNLDLPKKIGQLGIPALPVDFLPLVYDEISTEFRDMYWHYGRRLLAASSVIRQDPRLHAVYLSNFSCGPDSFLVRFFKELMGDKPFLLLELDEHSADAGLVTRLEAFLDSIRGKSPVGHPRAIRTDKTIRKGRTIYIPNMCDHAQVLNAALHSVGVESEVMEESNNETLVLGRALTSGRECFPAIVTAGDMIRATRRPDFDPERSAFFMPQGSGPCRFGQYHRLHRLILDEVGFKQVPIYAPNQGPTLYEDLGPLGYRFVYRMWQGLAAVDGIDRLARRIRPYEDDPGMAQQLYDQYLRDLCGCIEHGRSIHPLLERARDDFAAIPAHPACVPRIGIVGEIFVRAHRFSNNYLVKTLETLGCEVLLPPITEWFLYTNFTRIRRSWIRRELRRHYVNRLVDAVMRHEEHKICRRLGLPSETSEEKLIEDAAPYIHDSFEGEAILSVGKTLDFIKTGAGGVINVMPFTCMPGNIVTTMYKKLKEDHGDFPLLVLSFDGLAHATDRMRIEAFVHQAKARMAVKKGETGRSTRADG